MKLITSIFLSITLLFSVATYADNCGIPVDPSGDTLPILTGDIPYFKMPDALCADKGEYTWDYSGTVENANEQFSLQTTVAQFARTGKSGLGFHAFDFAFKSDGHFFFSNSTYGGKNNVLQAIAQSLDAVQSSATLEKFSVSATSLIDSSAQWHFTSTTRTPQPPLFKGWVGQPGQHYNLSGVGTTFLWKYNASSGTSTVMPYTYSFSVDVVDERGATMEGMGGGYVGPQLIPSLNNSGNGYNVESEIAQPRLKVLNWNVIFNAVGAVKTGYKSTYTFSGNNGMLWNDFGPVDRAGANGVTGNQKLANLIQQVLPSNANQKFNLSNKKMSELGNLKTSGLYNGNWIPVSFTRGKYAGATIVFSVFWNKNEKNPNDQTTNNIAWSNFGWANFYSGFIPNEIDSAFSTLETLYPQNPALPNVGTTETPPYSVKLDQFVPSKFNMAFPWAQKITITIKANTPLRYAMAAYADQLAKNNSADDPSQDIVITVRAISPITQNTLFSSSITQYYEGAAVPTINGERVGYSWIEHMVK
ncbi:MAG TPA: hypothetical protein VJK30_05310 [Coxiellaceae bacterium]|nr:MAG: hypothetical protein A3E81_00945 [Gammaproteobacteria bacterium RIFCSPHIGHO2_12_FULL_36_30]HLB56728.1 hypothetical protein [Coxiellaceae bacterium]